MGGAHPPPPRDSLLQAWELTCTMLIADKPVLIVVDYHPFEFFLNNTNLTLLAFLYKIDIEWFQNQQK